MEAVDGRLGVGEADGNTDTRRQVDVRSPVGTGQCGRFVRRRWTPVGDAARTERWLILWRVRDGGWDKAAVLRRKAGGVGVGFR